MYFTLTTLAAIALGANQALAGREFWISAGHIEGFGGPVGETGNHWLVVDNLECGSLTGTHGWSQRSDVSGGKKGVRVKFVDGDCGDDFFGHQCPDQVELNTDEWHRTWYADRGGDMVDTNGNSVAHCDIDMSTDKKCDLNGGYGRYQSLLHCMEH